MRQEARAEQEAAWERSARVDIESIEPRLNENHPEYDRVYDTFTRDMLDKRLTNHVEKFGTQTTFDYKAALSEVNKEWDAYVGIINKSYIAKQKVLAKEK